MAAPDTPSYLVIFGATGDLTQRKLIPALFNLLRKGKLPDQTRIIGFGRRDWSDEQFAAFLLEAMQRLAPSAVDEALWPQFTRRLHFFGGDLDVPEDFAGLKAYLDQAGSGHANCLFYLATAPSYYEKIIEQLGAAGLANAADGEWRRVIVEKPFGRDGASARHLNGVIHAVFAEESVYRIDHYLGKETAQNLLFLRFANTIFEPVWNRRYVSNVQISVAETVDVEHRGAFYDQTGVLRDMFQNHLLQLLTLVAMEPPASFDADALRNEKTKVLSAIRPIRSEDVVLGQYEGYLKARGVASDSQTPTFAALRLSIDNWRWKGVPFYLRSGKALKSKVSEIMIEFQRPPHVMFNLPPGKQLTPNYLSICIQPDEGIHLKFETKQPESFQDTRSVDMEFHYADADGGLALPEAYERLLLDALLGDASLFARSDEIERAWKLIDPLLEAGIALHEYPAGSWGPPHANQLIHAGGFFWREGCGVHTSKHME